MKTSKQKPATRAGVLRREVEFMTGPQLITACEWGSAKPSPRARIARDYAAAIRPAHTPGPWKVRRRENAHGGFYIEPGIGEVLGNGLTPEANAKLIGAAPALLAAVLLSRRNAGSLLHMLPVNADRTERKSLEKWLGELNAALATANVF